MPRERSLRSEAVVVRRTDFAEADRLVTLYTRDFGKLKAIAKGARKPQSRKTGHVELFMRSKFLIATGKDLGIITQAEMVEAYAPLRDDLIKATYASYAVELLDRFTVEEDKNLSLYKLIADGLGWFAYTADFLLAARYYELHLLELSGFSSLNSFFVCPVEKISRNRINFLAAELGGVLCPDCHEADRRAQSISAVAVKVLRYLQTRSWETVKVLQLKRPLHSELENIMYHYLTYILERNLKSVDFLHRLRQEAALFTNGES